jgi:solute carrier family 25 2-oxodicarboxylate transporter 21
MCGTDVIFNMPYFFFFLQTFSLAGLGAGVTEAVLVNPFEVVKVSLQANRAHLKEVPSTWAITKQIVSTQV